MRKLEAGEAAPEVVTAGSTPKADDPVNHPQLDSATVVEGPSEHTRGATLAYKRVGGTSSG